MSAKSNNPTDPRNEAVKKSSVKVDHGLQCWLVVASCSLINLILFGIYRSYALLYTALLEDYHITRTQASWPFSLCMTIIHLTGPISGLLNSKFSIRTIYATGCFLSTLGIGLCYFAVNVTDISLYIGVIQGFGIGLTYVQSVAILSEYFTEKLGIANGISMAGGTIGPFILSPLLEFFLENYKLKGSYIMLTAVTMLTIPLCIVLKHNRKRYPLTASGKFSHFRSSKSYDLQHGTSKPTHASQPPVSSDAKLDVSLQRFKPLDELDTQQVACKPQPTDNERQKAINLAFIEDQLTNSIAPNPIAANQASQLKIGEQASKGNSHSLFIIDCSRHQTRNPEHQPSSSPIELRKSLFALLKRQLSKFKSTSKRVSSIKKPALKLTNSISSNSMVSFTIQNLFTTMSSVYFLLICMTHLAYFWAVITFQMVIVDFSMDCHIPKHLANNMITAFSFGDLVGRLGSGWIIDKKLIANKLYFLAGNLLIAILFNLLSFVNDYYGLLVITTVLGILSGMIVILINVCLCEYLGKNKASLAFGLSAFFCGLATLARPNLVGYFRDIQGSYIGLFSLLSLLCYTASLIWMIETIVARLKIKQKLSNGDLPPIDRRL